MIDRFGETELVQLTNKDNNAATSIDDPALDQALADANAEIDGYLTGRYALPLDPVPLMLKRSACDIARYHLFDDRVTEQVQKRYDGVVAFLRSVGKGDISLGVDAASQPAGAAGGPEVAPGNERVFTQDSLADY
jgi:phage gp36-like protein